MAKFDFDPKDNKLNLSNALCMVKASSLAYKLEKNTKYIERFVEKEWQMKDFEFIQKDDTECFIAANKNVILLSFQGTEKNSLKDWVTDAKFRKKIGPWGRGVHRGFKSALEVAWDGVDSYISKLNKSLKRPLFITGHSLGGALATLATAKFLQKRVLVSAMYTFGQPLVGSKDFARKFNRSFKNAYRFVNNEDMVTRVPPEIFNYGEIGYYCYFNNKRQLLINPDKSYVTQDRKEAVEIRNCAELHRLHYLYPNAVKDHDLGKYISNIEKALREKSWEIKPERDFLKYVNQ